MHLCLCVCIHHMSTDTYGGQKKVIGSFKPPVWVLGAELTSSIRAETLLSQLSLPVLLFLISGIIVTWSRTTEHQVKNLTSSSSLLLHLKNTS